MLNKLIRGSVKVTTNNAVLSVAKRKTRTTLYSSYINKFLINPRYCNFKPRAET